MRVLVVVGLLALAGCADTSGMSEAERAQARMMGYQIMAAGVGRVGDSLSQPVQTTRPTTCSFNSTWVGAAPSSMTCY